MDSVPIFRERTAGIYAIRHTESGRVYVGSAVNLRKRQSAHLTMLRRELHSNPHLQNAWTLYGEAAFTFEILEHVLDTQQLVTREQHWLDQLSAHWKLGGFNARPFAQSNLGHTHSEETKRKVALAGVGRPKSAETRERLSKSLKGLVKTDGQRLNLSISRGRSGRAWSPDGVEYRFHSIKKFAAEHGLNSTLLREVAYGKRLWHKRWRAEFDDSPFPPGHWPAPDLGYRVTGPTGETWDIFSMRHFCREHGLNTGALHNTMTGRNGVTQHKGYRIEKIEDAPEPTAD